MTATLTTIALTRALAPLCADLYKGTKGIVQSGLDRWKTTAGIKKACVALGRIEKVKTIWSPEAEVSLRSFYFPSKLQTKPTSDESPTLISTDDITFLPPGNIVIEGIVGQGKSIFMRHLASSALNLSSGILIPVFIELRTITSKRTLSNAVSAFLETISVDGAQATFDYLADSGKIILLLDGFDEIPSECIGDVIYELGNIQTRNPELKIIISSRPRNHIQNTNGFQVLKLVKLTEGDYDSFISKLIISSSKRLDVVQALKDCSDNIKGVISTPLMLTLVVIVYQTEKEIPSTLSDFFEKLFGVVFTKHDRLKAGFNRQHHSGLSERKLKQLFDTFCFMVVRFGGTRSLDNASFEKAFEDAISYAPQCFCDLDNFRNDIIKVACLMVEEGFDTTTFLHKSILDYHAASFVKNLKENTAINFYESAFNNHRLWMNVVEFLKSIDSFRYYRHYVIKFLKKPLAQLVSVVNTRDLMSLTAYLDSLFPDFTFDFSNYELQTIGPFNNANIELYDLIGDAITASMPYEFEESPDHEEIDRAVKLSRKENSKMVGQSITLRQYISNFDMSPLWAELSNIESDYSMTCAIAQAAITLEKAQAGLFREMLRETPSHDDLQFGDNSFVG
ncbi:NACHT domain-containing protein [Pseudomonas fragariae (ex Marin et al. 2024)]|uniref:NACHT domain-containing protein n=1 Tax=Pseudomonas TaxID=286 RepID=UPI000446C335|nr:hypothetical protein [Pseudomonas syringae]AKF48574.1 putative NTPase (NACHT family) [Pseudomonas syringae pv. syringae B301D]EXL29033.1 NTPase [Pseudomonas syringae pv. syringae str. B301D-R]KWS27761.1 hypothetical protein AL062_08470 [Pseudomonas syringae pv. syringae]